MRSASIGRRVGTSYSICSHHPAPISKSWPLIGGTKSSKLVTDQWMFAFPRRGTTQADPTGSKMRCGGIKQLEGAEVSQSKRVFYRESTRVFEAKNSLNCSWVTAAKRHQSCQFSAFPEQRSPNFFPTDSHCRTSPLEDHLHLSMVLWGAPVIANGLF